MKKLFTLKCFVFAFIFAIGFIKTNAQSKVVISQVYGGAGCGTAGCSSYQNDFIELFNAGNVSQSLNGWSVQYASATGTAWQVTSLTSITLQPGQYYLVAQAGNANGVNPLPSPDATGTIAMSGTAAKVAVVSNTVALSGGCPSSVAIIDFVGYGTTANCFEGAASAPAPSTTTSIIRNNGGCTDAGNNSTDFLALSPTPRNTSSPFNVCNTFYVDDNSNTDDLYTLGSVPGNDANPGTAAAPFATIQHAISVAPAGSTIYVDAGTFTLTSAIGVNKQLIFKGRQAGVDARTRGAVPETIVDAINLAGFPSTAFHIQPAASGSIIDGFTVQGANGGQGVGGIYLASGTNGNTIQNNIIQNNHVGIFLANNSATAQTLITQNLFRNNTATGSSSGHGIYADNSTAGSDLQNVLIKDNIFTNTSTVVASWAIGMSNAGSTAFTNFTIQGNQVSNHGRGMYFYATSNCSITGNTFTGATNYAVGIFDYTISNSSFTITNNTFTSNFRGTWVDQFDNSIAAYTGTLSPTGNTFTGGTYHLVNSAPVHPATTINAVGNTYDGVLLDGSTSLANIYTIADKVLDEVDVSTYGKIILKANNIYVTANSFYAPETTTPSIQRGVDAAASGNTVNVNNGTFNGNVSVPKSLTINGANVNVSCSGSRVAESIINGTLAGNNATVSVGANAVTINGFTLTNPLGAYGISANARSNMQVLHNIITNVGNNTTGSGASYGVYFEVGSTNSSAVTISNNCINNIRGGENTSLTGPAGKANNGSSGGVLIGSSNATAEITGLVISGNKISDITASTIAFADGGKGAYGVIINAGAGASFAGKATNAQVTANEIDDLEGLWAHGVGLEGETPGANVANNIVNDLTDHKGNTDAIGVLLEQNDGAATVTINNNSFTNMPLTVKNLMAPTVNAECNWHGSANQSAIAPKISGNVDYIPSLTSGTDDQPATTGFQPAAGTCNGPVIPTTFYVNDNNNAGDIYTTAPGNDATGDGSSTAPFATITKAVSVAAAGNTIYVDAGTYVEQVSINKTLTILGAGRSGGSTTHLKAPATLIPVANANGSYHPIVYASGTGNNITIKMMLIDGDGGRNQSNFLGVYYYEANGTFENNRITAIQRNPFDGVQDGDAMYINHQFDVPLNHTVTINNNIIDNYQKTGIIINELNTQGIVTNNTITGKSITGVLAQNGIQYGFGSYGTITGNTVSGNLWNSAAPHTYMASGILLVGVGVDNTNTPTGNATTIGGAGALANNLNGNETGLYTDGDFTYGYNSNANVTYGGDAYANNKVHVYINSPSSVPTASNTYDKRVDNPAQNNTVFGSIQYGVDFATAGNTLNASAGTFTENVSVPKSLTINGANVNVSCSGSRVAESIINGTLAGNNATVSVGANAVTINGFTITNPLGAYGISATSRSNLQVLHNIITNVGNNTTGIGASYGVYFEVGSTNSSAVTISNNCINNIRGGENPSLVGNPAKANNGSSGGVLIGSSTASAEITGLVISGNKISNITASIALFADGGKGAYGVLINAGANASFAGKATNAQVTANEIDDLEGLWAHGVGLEGETPGANVANNIVNDLTDHKGNTDAIGVLLEQNDGAATVTINNNSFTNMPLTVKNLMTPTVNAECNWHGTASQAAVAAKISGNVDYIPYLTSGTDNQPATTGFQPAAGSCNGPQTEFYVNDTDPTGDHYTTAPGNDATGNGTAAAPYRTITKAISVASAGNTIKVDAGTYIEEIVVNKSLTILGSNESVNACSGTRVAESIIMPSTSQPFYDFPASTEVKMMQIEADNVVVKGFTFDGNNPALVTNVIDAADGIDVYVDVDGIIIQNNIFKNINEGGINAYPSGTTVQAENIINDNKFDNIPGNSDPGFAYSGYGIGVLVYNNFYTTINNNCMTNVRIGVQTGNYNLANTGATVPTINNNNIESKVLGIFHNLHYASASAFTINNNNISTVAGSTVNEGIEIASIQQTVSVNINNNNVTGAKYGIDLWNNPTSNTITITGGTLTNCGVGVFANNYDGYDSDAASSSYLVKQVTIQNPVDAGVLVKDNPLNSNGATVSLTLNNAFIIGGADGVQVTGADAYAIVNNNSITGSTDKFVDASAYTGATAINAECNWYGTTSQAAIAAKMAGNIDYIPYLTDGTDAAPATEGFQPVAGSCNGPLPTEFYVNDNSQVGDGYTTAVGNDATGNGSPSAPFRTIAKAISVASTGHTIYVDAGTYDENVSLNKSLTLKGTGNKTIIDPSTSCNGIGINITANNTTVDSLKVTDFNAGVFVGANQVLLRYVEATANCNRGIELGTSDDVDIFKCILTSNFVGLRIGTGALSTNVLVDSCEVHNNTQGIYAAYESAIAGSFNNVTIQNSDFSNNLQKGMYFEKLSNAVIQNIIMNNSGTDATYNFNAGIDINLKWAAYSNITIQNCEFTNCGVAGPSSHIESPVVIAIKARDDAPAYNLTPATLTGVNVLNNIIKGPMNGIRFGEFGKTNNTPTNVEVHENDLSGPFANKAIINNTPVTTNATCNWFGTTSAAVIAPKIQGPVNYIPFLVNGTDDQPSTRGFQPVAGSCTGYSSELYVDDNSNSGDVYTPGATGSDVTGNGTQAAPFATVTKAISVASAGNTIYVDAGTYREDITVTKNLSFRGANYNVNPNTGSRVAESIIQPATSDVANNTVMYLNAAASGTTINGFTFDGDNPTLTSGTTSLGANIDAAEAIGAYDGLSNVTVSNNIIKNLDYAGVDFYNFYNGGAATTGNLITNNKFDNIMGVSSSFGLGVLIYNNCYTDITNNVTTRLRIGIQTGNFSNADPGNSHTISNNTIEAQRRGIFFNLHYSNSAAFNITSNTITRFAGAVNTDGIAVFSIQGNVGAVISDNNISGHRYGYNLWNNPTTNTVTITGGTVSNTDTAVYATNYSASFGNAATSSYLVKQLNIQNPVFAGVAIIDTSANTNNASVTLTLNNTFISGGAQGVTIRGADVTAVINNNSITGSADKYIDASAYIGATAINAECNWYGTTDAGAIGAKMAGNVDYLPFLTNGTDDQPATAGFQPVAGSCNGAALITYYPRTSATDLSLVSNWTDDPSGTAGASPANFTSPNQLFNLNNNVASPVVNGSWGISGGSNLFLNNTAPLVFTTTASFSLGAGSVADFNGKPVTIKSMASGTAYIGVIAGTLSNASNVTVERYLSSLNNRAYRLLAPSVNTVTNNIPLKSIRANWQEGVNNNPDPFVPNLNPVPGYGTHITGSMVGANGFDATQTGQASLFNYNHATETWSGINNTDINALDAKTGYLLFIRGDRSIDLNSTDNPLPSSNTTLRATGTLLTGTQSFTGILGNNGFNLVTNPYASPIDWSEVYTASTNLSQFYTLWDPNIGSRGGYVTVHTLGFNSTAGSNANQHIQSGQAFFVQASGVPAPTVNIMETHKSMVNNIDVFRAGAHNELFTSSLFYTNTQGTRINADGVTSLFNNNYSQAVDGNDATQIANWDEDIAITRNNSALSIESRPLIDIRDTIPFMMARLQQRTYEWQFNATGFNHPNLSASLIDNFTGVTRPVSLNGMTVVSFTVTSNPASSATNRFMIVFGPNVVLPVNVSNVKAYQKGKDIQVEWTAQAEANIEKYEVEESADGRQFSKATSVTARGAVTLTTYDWLDVNVNNGSNYYRIKAISKMGEIQYSKIVRVDIGKIANEITVFPNPLQGNVISLSLNLPKGKYVVTLTNKLGQRIFIKNIEHLGGASTQSLEIPSHIAQGSYQLSVSDGENNFVKQLIKE